MLEKTHELEIPLLLLGIENENDACLARLETALQSHKGLQRDGWHRHGRRRH